MVLGSYVDDAFGGANSRERALLTMNTLTIIGKATGAEFNLDKSEGPARELVVIGLCYSSIRQTCRLGVDKREKYIGRIVQALTHKEVTSAFLSKLAGNLSFAAWVEPFCRPLLSSVFMLIVPDEPSTTIALPPFTRRALQI